MSDTMPVSIEYYHALRYDSMLLEALRSCGVENWPGYATAVEMVEELAQEELSNEI